jgi:hypothetical protein
VASPGLHASRCTTSSTDLGAPRELDPATRLRPELECKAAKEGTADNVATSSSLKGRRVGCRRSHSAESGTPGLGRAPADRSSGQPTSSAARGGQSTSPVAGEHHRRSSARGGQRAVSALLLLT